MSIEGQGHFFTIYFPGFVCFVLYLEKISGERLQDHWSSGILFVITAAGVVLCGSPKKQPRTSSIVQFIFFFWSFEISGNILRNQKNLFV